MGMMLECLPHELLQHIILLAEPSILGALSCASTFWQSICEDQNMWRLMYMSYFGGPSDMGEYKASLIANFVTMQGIVSPNDKLLWAVLRGHYCAVHLLLSTTNADANYYDPVLNSSCLYLASEIAALEVVKELLAYGARVDENVNKLAETPLHVACKQGHVTIVQALLAHKANVNALDKYGRSALHKAAYEGRTEVVRILLQTPGLNVELEEFCYGQTALHVACARNHVEIASLLLRSHSNINAVDWDGWTPLHLACFKGNKSVVTALLSHDAGARAMGAQNRWGDASLTYNVPASFAGQERDLAVLFSNTVK